MRSPRWLKVVRDLEHNKTRTLLVVLSLAVGVFAVGMIAGSSVVMTREMNRSFAAANPSSAIMQTDRFDDAMLAAVRAVSGVRAAEARAETPLRVRVGPHEWRSLTLAAAPDYAAVQINKVLPVDGAWPPPDGEVVIEDGAMSFLRAKVGEVLRAETATGASYQLHIAGTARDIFQMSPLISGRAAGYVTLGTLAALGEPAGYTVLHVIVAERPFDREHGQQVANAVRAVIEARGGKVQSTLVTTPDQHPAGGLVQSLVAVMGLIGVLALLLSSLLVSNTMGAIFVQQVRQIGVMKAIGARRGQLVGMYAGMILLLGLLALAIAVPVAWLGMRLFTGFMASLINFTIADHSLPLQVLALQAGVALLVPLLAALYPIMVGTRVTVHEAIEDYGLREERFGTTRVDMLVGRIRGIGRPTQLALRNALRRKGRLALTLTALALASAIAIAILSVNASLTKTLNSITAYFDDDVSFNFTASYPVEQITQAAERVPGVAKVEPWIITPVDYLPAGVPSESIGVWAGPAQTETLRPTLMAGRWLRPEDEQTVVINPYLLNRHPGIKLGDALVLKLNGRATNWKVVGIIKAVPNQVRPVPFVYVPYPAFARALGEEGLANRVQVVLAQHDAQFQSDAATALDRSFKQAGIGVGFSITGMGLQTVFRSAFNILFVLLMVMALVLTVVGGLGLMGAMSLNVLERIREVGVLRAIGASTAAILRMVLVEALFVGLVSWHIGFLLALPLSRVLSDVVGNAFLLMPLDYIFSIGGALLWLIVVVILATLASLLPAWRASRVTVREVLLYA